jgi:hypothetical protein
MKLAQHIYVWKQQLKKLWRDRHSVYGICTKRYWAARYSGVRYATPYWATPKWRRWLRDRRVSHGHGPS